MYNIQKQQRPQSSNPYSLQKNRAIASILRSLPQELDLEVLTKIGTQLSDFKIIEELGRGSYGTVFKVQSIKNEKFYVLKKINMKHMKQKKQKEALNEVQLLRKVRHPNIIKYYTSFAEDESLFILMEYAPGGDLQHLGDLGVSTLIKKQGELHQTRVGTPLFLAPELVKQQPYDYNADIWALGCILYQAATFETPFSGDNLISLGYNIVNKFPKPLPIVYKQAKVS